MLADGDSLKKHEHRDLPLASFNPSLSLLKPKTAF
jgi:hypothetical protein